MEEDKVEMEFVEGDTETAEINEMEVDSDESMEAGGDKAILEDAKAKRAERRKAILKELEVCDLLDL
jgi:hypothetical protein